MPSSSAETRTTRTTRPSHRSGIGPIALVFPLCTLILGILWMRHGRPRTVGEHAEPPAPVQGDVPGWTGNRFLAGDVALSIQLAPLHTAPERQSLERRVLGERFGRGSGEPFRAILTLRAPAGAASEVELDASAVRVFDERGLALEPLVVHTPPEVAGEPAPPRTVADPLATLLAPPRQGLTVGQEVSLILWGRAPESAARIEGLGDPLPLTARPVPRSDLARSLARLDRLQGEVR